MAGDELHTVAILGGGMGIMAQLTEREREALRLLMAGKRRGEIAAEMCITRRTVKAHLDNARGKVGAKSAVQLAAIAASDGGE